ncbi:hypothetical protein X961_5657 [Burkholderia pseudomallei MSHR5613]|nr:hypothetical protein X961_5657 [Burkholderia pseudomallei MSHR5613]
MSGKFGSTLIFSSRSRGNRLLVSGPARNL